MTLDSREGHHTGSSGRDRHNRFRGTDLPIVLVGRWSDTGGSGAARFDVRYWRAAGPVNVP